MLICKIFKWANGCKGQKLSLIDNTDEINFNADGQYVEDEGEVTTHIFIIETQKQFENFVKYFTDLAMYCYNCWSETRDIMCDIYNERTNATLAHNFIKNATWYCEHFAQIIFERNWIRNNYDKHYVRTDFYDLNHNFLPGQLIKDSKDFQAYVLSECIAHNIQYEQKWFEISTNYAERKQAEQEIEKLQGELNSKLIEFESVQQEVNEYKTKLEELNKILSN